MLCSNTKLNALFRLQLYMKTTGDNILVLACCYSMLIFLTKLIVMHSGIVFKLHPLPLKCGQKQRNITSRVSRVAL